jgi:hypothetical protein
LFIKFDQALQTQYQHINSTITKVTNPPGIQGSSLLQYSTNDIYYYPILINNLQARFLYYPEINVISVTPDVIYDYIYSFIVYIEATGVIDNPLLRCKAQALIITPSITLINGKQYVLCEVPFYLIYNGIDLISNSVTSNNILTLGYIVPISLSNNNQQFSPSIQFTYIRSDIPFLKSFNYSPRFGPETGDTTVILTSSDFTSGINPFLMPLHPLCQFGNIITKVSMVTNSEIHCLTPKFDELTELLEYDEHLNTAVVRFNVTIYDHYIPMIFTYNLNVTVSDYYPDNVEVNKDVDLNIIGSGFNMYQSIACKFITSIGDIIVNAVSLSYSQVQCRTPALPAVEVVKVYLSLNGVDYYSFNDDIQIAYRNRENVLNVQPQYLTNDGDTVVTITTDYYFNSMYKYSFCILTDLNGNLVYKINTEYVSNNVFNCKVTNLQNFAANIYTLGGELLLNISSNDYNFSSALYSIYFYLHPTILAFDKQLIPVNNVPISLFVKGNNFQINLIMQVFITCKGYDNNFNEIDLEMSSIAEYSSQTELIIQNLNINNCIENRLLTFKYTYDLQNYIIYSGSVYSYNPPNISNLFPNIYVNQLTTAININVDNKLIDNIGVYSLKCLIDTYLINALVLDDFTITCPLNVIISSSSVGVSLLINNYIITNKQQLKIITFNIVSHALDTTIYRYQYPSDIVITGTNFDITITYYIRIGDYIWTAYSVTNTEVKFDRNISLTQGSYSVYVSVNLADWIYLSDITVDAKNCDDGISCVADNKLLLNAFECPVGFYCNNGYIVKCARGTYSDTTKNSSCLSCPQSKFCPNQDLINPSNCPTGFNCNSATGLLSISQLNLCPLGKICFGNSIIDCPNGYYCPEGSYLLTPDTLNTGSPKPCTDGMLCKSKDPNIDQYGTYLCPDGYYCNHDYIQCPLGYECTNSSSYPLKCPPGTYLDSIALNCLICPLGSICSYGTILPTPCPSGRICSISGQFRPFDLCPPGYYCDGSIIGLKNSLIVYDHVTLNYFAKQCRTGYYCTGGETSNIMNQADPESPQPCIAGMICNPGNINFGEFCPRGYYCPPFQIIPAPTGSYVPGVGFSNYLKCPPGTFSSLTAQTECKVCEAGTFTNVEGSETCTQCPKGTYRSADMSGVNCNLCPTSTYNENTGSTKLSDCVSCPKKYLCDIEGMSNFEEQAKPCPQGYMCVDGTNSFNIQQCPPGFWCGLYTSEMSEWNFCEKGFYCNEGTTETTKNANICPAGYFCPYGTYSKVNDEGKFTGVYTTPLLREVTNVMSLIDPSIIDLIYKPCDENINIPVELLEAYAELKTLKCPPGTTSLPGSNCIGQCKKISNDIVVYNIDPVSAVIYKYLNTTNTTEPMRILQDTNTTNTNSTIDATEIPNKFLSIEPFELIYVSIDISKIPSYLVYNEHYTLNIYTINNGTRTTLALPPQMTDPAYNRQEIAFRLFNFNTLRKQIEIIISINNDLFSSLSTYFKNIAIVTKYLPQRSEVGSNKLFTFYFTKDSLSDVMLPYNFYSHSEIDEQPILIDLFINKTHGYQHKYENDPYDILFFERENITSITMPWIPYLSNCEGNDNRIILYDILENNNGCIFPTTMNIVQGFPLNGLNPISDVCYINLKCRYDELLYNNIGKFKRWFSITSPETLFYVTKNPIDIINATNFEQDYVTSHIENEDQEFIPVQFTPHNITTNCLPSDVIISINYYQVDEYKKQIVSFDFDLYNYTNCVNTTNYNNTAVYYNTIISFQPLGYLDLVDNFQFSVTVYIVLFSCVAIICFVFVLMIWGLNYLISLVKKRPNLQVKTLLYTLYLPFIKASYISLIPFLLICGYIYILKYGSIFTKYSLRWDFVLDDPKYIDHCRTGLQFFFFSLCAVYHGMRYFIPMPYPNEKKIIEEELHAKAVKPKEEFKDDEDYLNKDTYDDIEDVDQYSDYYDVFNSLNWKRCQAILKYIFFAACLLMKLEFSYTDTFGDNLYLFIVLQNIYDVVYHEICLEFIFKEALVSVPLYCLSKLISFLTFLGANKFKEFILCYILIFLIRIISNIYLQPVLDLGLVKIKRFIKRILKFELEELEEIPHSIERILRSMVSISASIICVLLIPLMITLTYFFQEECQLHKKFHISSFNIIYYLCFAVVIIIPELINQIFIIHSIELAYGFKIQEYLEYCSYRYRVRKTKWINMKYTMDPSINLLWRSLDAMLFSEQYYIMIIINTCGGFLLIFAILIFLRNNYNPFYDPFFFVYFIIILSISVVVVTIYSYLGYLFNIFRLTKHDEENFLVFLKINTANENMARFMMTDIYRNKFISVNKEWLIENLEKILNFDFKANVKNSDELQKQFEYIYKAALECNQIDKSIHVKKDSLKKDFQISLKQSSENDSNIFEDKNINKLSMLKKLVHLNLNKQSPCAFIARLWLNKAKEILRFKTWSEDIINSIQMDKCVRCNNTDNVKLILQTELQVLVTLFLKQQEGKNFNKKHWERFYIKNQKFIILCSQCEYIRDLNKIFSSDYKKNKDLPVKLKLPHVKAIMFNWLMEARSRILLSKLENN